MSLDDARRTGETIRQLFFDAKLKLPTRVVIHKRTPFRKEEQDGLTAGLEGVPHIEMLEINFEESLRYTLRRRCEMANSLLTSFPSFAGRRLCRATTLRSFGYTVLRQASKNQSSDTTKVRENSNAARSSPLPRFFFD